MQQLTPAIKNRYVKNSNASIMDFDYYKSVGLLTDEMIQQIAHYQRNIAVVKEQAINASTQMQSSMSQLREIIGYIDFCKLSVTGVRNDGGYLCFDLDQNYEDGVVYRTDYTNTRRNKQFNWIVTGKYNSEKEFVDGLDSNGDPINNAASLVYIVHHSQRMREDGTWPQQKPNEVSYDKAYLRFINGGSLDRVSVSGPITNITVWASMSDVFKRAYDPVYDEIYLFQSHSIGGYLGSYESMDQAAVKAIDNLTTIATSKHPVTFVQDNGTISLMQSANINGWQWLWAFNSNRGEHPQTYIPSTMYFNRDGLAVDGQSYWHRAFFSDTEPVRSQAGDFWYNWRTSKLYTYSNSKWVRMQSATDEKIASNFGAVQALCKHRDKYYQGSFDYYDYDVPTNKNLIVGNYYFKDEYDNIISFTTKNELKNEDIPTGQHYTIRYDTERNATVKIMTPYEKDGQIENKEQLILAKTHTPASVKYHPQNVCANYRTMQKGGISDTGTITQDEQWCHTTGSIPVYPDLQYEVTGINGAYKIAMYNSDQKWLQTIDMNASSATETKTFNTVSVATRLQITGQLTVDPPTFTVDQNGNVIATSAPGDNVYYTDGTYYIKIFKNVKQSQYRDMPNIRFVGYRDSIIISDVTYTKLNDIHPRNDDPSIVWPHKSILYFMKRFTELTQETYVTKYNLLRQKQDRVTKMENHLSETLGDIYRESTWQDSSYVESHGSIVGDEERLYTDALANLEKIAKPQTKYSISYLDLYNIQNHMPDYGTDDVTASIPWPDISVTSAVHVIDEQLGIDQWAYIDKIAKCYDNPRKTTISINTDLTTMTQHSFTDVLTNIANVANSAKTTAIMNSGGAGYFNGNSIAKGTILGDSIVNGSISLDKLNGLQNAIENIVDNRLANLRIGSQNIDRATIGYANIDSAMIDTLAANAASIAKADIQTADINFADIQRLFAQQAYIGDAFISNAMIQNLDAGKIRGIDGDFAAATIGQLQVGSINGTLLAPNAVDMDKLSSGVVTYLRKPFALYYGSHVPKLTNAPANEWEPSTYEDHTNSFFYSTQTNSTYEFKKQDGEYLWTNKGVSAAGQMQAYQNYRVNSGLAQVSSDIDTINNVIFTEDGTVSGILSDPQSTIMGVIKQDGVGATILTAINSLYDEDGNWIADGSQIKLHADTIDLDGAVTADAIQTALLDSQLVYAGKVYADSIVVRPKPDDWDEKHPDQQWQTTYIPEAVIPNLSADKITSGEISTRVLNADQLGGFININANVQFNNALKLIDDNVQYIKRVQGNMASLTVSEDGIRGMCQQIMDDSGNAISVQFAQTAQRHQELYTQVNSLDEKVKLIKTDIDGLTISDPNNNTSMNLNDHGLQFSTQQGTVAYISTDGSRYDNQTPSQSKMYISRVQMTKSIQLGNLLGFVDDDGSITWMKTSSDKARRVN